MRLVAAAAHQNPSLVWRVDVEGEVPEHRIGRVAFVEPEGRDGVFEIDAFDECFHQGKYL